MKKLILFLSSFFLLGIFSFAQGVQFKKYSWSDAIEQATKENKIIFLDANTSWCAPCKKMEKQIFPDKKVGSFSNENFINLKIDMEKGEGVELAQRYEVNVYPTLLFIGGDGSIIHRTAGFHNAEGLIDLANIALDPNKRISSLQERFESGDRDADFLYNYTIARFNAHDGSHSPIAEAYMTTQKDWSTEESMRFIIAYVDDTNSTLFDYMIENKSAFVTMFGQRAIAGKLQQLLYTKINDEEDKPTLEEIDEIYKKIFPETAEKMSARFRLTYYRQAGDRDNYAKAAVSYLDKFPNESPDELNEIAWTFYRVVEDKKLLKQASKWAKKSIKYDSNYFNHDTLAALYFKLGKKGKAKKTALKAIDLAKAANEDYSETEKILAEINKM